MAPEKRPSENGSRATSATSHLTLARLGRAPAIMRADWSTPHRRSPALASAAV